MTPILIFDELDSTNAEARRMAEAGDYGPAWVFTRNQTAGRGRRGRSWNSGGGNLTATHLLPLDKPAIEAAQVAFVAGLATYEMLEAYVPSAAMRLKWPNDVLIDGKKVSGMLVESGPTDDGRLWLAVGVGVNIADYPTDVERLATGISEHLRHDVRHPPEVTEALSGLIKAFDAHLSLWLAEGFAPIRQAWLARAGGLGQPCTARLERETLTGVAEGLDADGALLLRLPGGMLRRITAGDVFFGAPS